MLSPISLAIDLERNGGSPNELQRRAMLKDSIRLLPGSKGISELRENFSRPLHVVFGMLAIGLFLVCINVVSLQIARSDESRKEFSIRLAIGAGRFRVARQCMVEMFLVSLVSGFLALLACKPIAKAVVSIMTVWGNVPAQLPLRVSGNPLLFGLLITSAITVLCGFLPALYATRKNLQAGLQAGSLSIAGQPSSLIRIVGVVQIAVSLILITATCLFALNLGQLRRFDSGLNRDRLLQVEVDPSAAGYDEARAVLLDDQLRTRFAPISGIRHVTYSANGLYSGRNSSGGFAVDGDASPAPDNHRYGIYDYVGPSFFTTLGTAILAGRDFTDRDTASSARVVIINQTLATRFFPDRNPIGKNFYISEGNHKSAYQIIGVVRDVRSNLRTTRLTWYFAALQHRLHPFSSLFLVRTEQDRAAVVSRMRSVIHDENPKLEITSVESANELFDLTVQSDRLLAALGWTFGILAILLACAGIYGLLSYDVTKRRNEIGIRTALGAQPSDVRSLMLTKAVIILAFGLVLGGIAANILTRLLQTLVFGMQATDLRIELAAGLILMAVGLVAAWFPIQRATRVDPVRALRTE